MNTQALELERLARERGSNPPEGRRALAVAVAGGKGGVGKSTIATGLACALAELGAETILVDAVFGHGSCDLLLGVSPAHRADDVIAGGVDVRRALAPITPHLSLLAAPAGSERAADPPPAARHTLAAEIAELRAGCDLLVVDLAPGISRDTTSLAAWADVALVVVNPEPASVAGAYALVKILAARRSSPAHLVLNRVTPAAEPAALIRRFHRITGRFLNQRPPVLGAVEEDPRVVEAARALTPLLVLAPETRAAVSMRRMARKLLSFSASVRRGQGFVAR